MTRLELSLSQKPSGGGQQIPSDVGDVCDPTAAVVVDVTGNTNDGCESPTSKTGQVTTTTVDWQFVRRVSVIQMFLSMASLVCLSISIILGGMTAYKFTAFFWSIYLFTTGYTGLRSALRNYVYVIAYLIMTSFQSLTNWFSLVYLTAYRIDSIIYYHHDVGIRYKDLALFLELTESLTLMGTIVTGLFGAMACCKGLGRLLTHHERMIEQRLIDASR